jgi:hypothetical protein
MQEQEKTAIVGALGLSSSLAVGQATKPSYSHHTEEPSFQDVPATVELGGALNIVVQVIIGVVTLIKLLKGKRDKH